MKCKRTGGLTTDVWFITQTQIEQIWRAFTPVNTCHKGVQRLLKQELVTGVKSIVTGAGVNAVCGGNRSLYVEERSRSQSVRQ